MVPFTSDEIEHIAATSAKRAVSELLLAMGVNTDNPNALIEMQKDFAHVRKWRESVELVRIRTITVAVGVIVTGILGALYMAFKPH